MTTPGQYRRIHLTYQAESHLRIGHRKVGNLQTTRLYVPGIAMWASTVNRLAALGGGDLTGERLYNYWGRMLHDYCRFSCLFMVDDGGNMVLPDRPGGAEERLALEREFVSSTTLTAINHASGDIAEEGFLHELEWLLPVGRHSERQLTLQGWVDVNISGNAYFGVADDQVMVSGCNGEQLSFTEILAVATVGADLNKGCGRLRLKEWRFDPVPVEPHESSKPVPGPLLAEGLSDVSGRLETVVGRTWLPLNGEGAHTVGRPGGYFYQFLVYTPGATTTHPLEMDWKGYFGLPAAQNQTGV